MTDNKHIISMLVEDHPGVFTRIPGMFGRRGYNIETITVGKSMKEGISKIVMTVLGDDRIIEQVEKQLNKLVDVIKVTEMKRGDSVIRELCLIKVSAKTKKAKDEIFNYAKIYKIKFVDVSPETLSMELIGTPEKIDSFIELIKGYGIHDISRTGVTAINRAKNGNKN